MRNVLITGGSEGIGLAVARRLAVEKDTRVTLVARNEAKLRETGFDYIVADLSQPAGVELVTQRLRATHYDVLINNAGAGLYGRFTELTLEDQLHMMRLIMDSVVVLSHAYLRAAKPGDALVNTASFLAYAPFPGAAAYSATKAFVATLSEALWWEYKKKGIYVLGFSPGVIATGFHKTAGASVASFPSVLVQSPERAAGELLAALRKRKAPRVISGVATRLLIRLHRLVSRKTAINMMGRSSPIREDA